MAEEPAYNPEVYALLKDLQRMVVAQGYAPEGGTELDLGGTRIANQDTTHSLAFLSSFLFFFSRMHMKTSNS